MRNIQTVQEQQKNPFPIWTFILFSFPIFFNFWTIWIANYIAMMQNDAILSNCITIMQNDTILSNCIKISFSQIHFQFYFNFFPFFLSLLYRSHILDFFNFFQLQLYTYTINYTVWLIDILTSISFIFSSSKLESWQVFKLTTKRLKQPGKETRFVLKSNQLLAKLQKCLVVILMKLMC